MKRARAAGGGAEIPCLRRTEGRIELMVEGRPFVMLSGEVHNSSASSLEYMERSWDRIVSLHCNSAIAPVYWELIEPEEGRFDFRLVEGLIEGARKRGLRLVLLWFGTWKNAHSTYAPAWVKTDLARFPRAQAKPGENSAAISAWSTEACAADARAFAAVMRHVKEVDGDDHTVVMVQVENETGLLGAARDHHPLAEAAFGQQAPQELMDHLVERREALEAVLLAPELRGVWEEAGGRERGTWSEVFGEGAAEVFMAWHLGQFVNAVAAAGKAEYPLPMFANAWLVHYAGQSPGEYPSGGPVAKMMDVWQAAAPAIDVIAPDIYRRDFRQVCAEYARAGNPLLIPEAHVIGASGNAFYALAEHDAICFAPFAIDGDRDFSALGESYEFLGEMLPVVVRHRGTGQMVGIVQEGAEPREVEVGAYRLVIRFNRAEFDAYRPGRGLVIALAPEEFLVAGAGYSVEFRPRAGGKRHVEHLSVEEGSFRGGEWIPGRRLNGDELNCRLGDRLEARRARLHSFD